MKQKDRILKLLKSKENKWVSLKDIQWLGIMQYNARIFWLRKQWYKIENKTEWKKHWFFGDKQKHSFYKLITI